MSSPQAPPEMQFHTASTPEAFFRQLEEYPWSTDEDFQSGLTAILGPSPGTDSAQDEDLALRARCFYYSRKASTEVDFFSYRKWRASQPPSSLAPVQLPYVNTRSIESTLASQLNSLDAESLDLLSETRNEGTANRTASESQGQYPSKFAQIVDLIQSGKPVPGIKDIPNTILVGQGTKSAQIKRRKPWEQAGSAEVTDRLEDL